MCEEGGIVIKTSDVVVFDYIPFPVFTDTAGMTHFQFSQIFVTRNVKTDMRKPFPEGATHLPTKKRSIPPDIVLNNRRYNS